MNLIKTKDSSSLLKKCYDYVYGFDFYDAGSSSWIRVDDGSTNPSWVEVFATAKTNTEFSYTATFKMTLDS